MGIEIQDTKTASAENEPERSVSSSMWKGFRRRCPKCGTGALFERFLKTRHACSKCSEGFHHHRADDGPAYLTIFIVGHIIVPLILAVEMAYHPPILLQMGVWLTLAAVMSLLLLEPIKGAFVGLQWALRMHGFGEPPVLAKELG